MPRGLGEEFVKISKGGNVENNNTDVTISKGFGNQFWEVPDLPKVVETDG